MLEESRRTTWDIGLQALQSESRVAADLLNLCAFLSPDGIPRELLSGGGEQPPQRLATTLSIDEAAYGPDHPTVATGLGNLSNVLRDLGDLPGAKTNLERAPAIRRKVLGEEHAHTRRVQMDLDSLSG